MEKNIADSQRNSVIRKSF